MLQQTKKIRYPAVQKKTESGIDLIATEYLNTREFFKEGSKGEGGIFRWVNTDIFKFLPTEIHNSPAIQLVAKELVSGREKSKDEENFYYESRKEHVFEKTDMAHLKQVCELNFIGSNNFLSRKGFNIFWMRNPAGELYKVYINFWEGEMEVDICRYGQIKGCGPNRRAFFDSNVLR